LLYGLRFDLNEIPGLIRDSEDDPDDIIDNVLGATEGTYRERLEKRGAFASRYLGGHRREALVLACFCVEVRTWGVKTFEIPTEETLDGPRHVLRAAAVAAGFAEAATRECAWYLEADFG
jgi:hypothetical protein